MSKNKNQLATIAILTEKYHSPISFTAEMIENDVIMISDNAHSFHFEFSFDPDKDDLNRVTIVHNEIHYDADVETTVDANGVVKCFIHPLYEANGEVLCDSDAIQLDL
jgi:hypothetical protein